jgi:hypothetical protein
MNKNFPCSYRTIARILPGNATTQIHRVANQPNIISLGFTILNNLYCSLLWDLLSSLHSNQIGTMPAPDAATR